MRKITIGMIIPIANDPTSFYRGMGPFTALKDQIPEINFIFPNPVDWATLKMCDMLFMQRPAMPEHFHFLVMAKDKGIPVWIDFDDDNLSVPKDNPTHGMYSQPAVKDAIVKLSRYCDVLTVSTEFLRKKYSIYQKNTYLVPNALDEVVLKFRALPTTPRNKMLLWRGTASHHRNLKVVEKEIIDTANKYPDWRFGFLGGDPIDITDSIKNFQVMPPTGGPNGIYDYYKTMVNLHPTALYYVLNKTDHSLARSHVCWLEATFGNMLSILPKLPEFERPGALNFATPSEFTDILESVIIGQVDIDKHIEESWQHIQENYMLSKINGLRKQILEQLIP